MYYYRLPEFTYVWKEFVSDNYFHQHAFMLIYQQPIDMKDWWAVINNHYLNRKHHVGRP